MRPRMPFRPCSMPPSLQGRAQQTGFQGLSAQAGEQPGAGHRLRLARQQRRRRAFAECQRAAAGECRLEGLRRQFDKTQREGEETRRLSLPRHVARHPRSLAQVGLAWANRVKPSRSCPHGVGGRPGGTRMSSGCSRSRW